MNRANCLLTNRWTLFTAALLAMVGLVVWFPSQTGRSSQIGGCLTLAAGMVFLVSSWIGRRAQVALLSLLLPPMFIVTWVNNAFDGFALKDSFVWPRQDLQTLIASQSRLRSNLLEFQVQSERYSRARSLGDLSEAEQPRHGVRILRGHMALEPVKSWTEADAIWDRARIEYPKKIDKWVNQNEPELSNFRKNGIPWSSAYPATCLNSLAEAGSFWIFLLLIQILAVQTRSIAETVATSRAGIQAR